MSDVSVHFEPRPLVFGRYCLLERINAGGMAEIFRARPFYPSDPTRSLVMKRILPHLADDREFVTMFVDEARITAQLSHPNICQLYELGLLDGTYYIVMEHIAGQDLLALINGYRRVRSFLPPAQVAFIVAELCAGLDYAHAKRDSDGKPLGVVHRDISPQNILIGYDGAVKVIDFGIARASVRRQRTEVGVLKGKFGYMSPEQVRGEDVDHRADIFATGVLLWEMLTARRLFYTKKEYEIVDRVLHMEVPPPSHINPQVPPELDAIVARALERDKNRRYSRANEMREELLGWGAPARAPYTRRTLRDWMQHRYAAEIAEEQTRSEAFARFLRPSDVALYYEQLGEPLAALEGERPASVMSEGEITRLDRELTSVSDEVLVIAEDTKIPVTSLRPPQSPAEKARQRGLAAIVVLAVLALVAVVLIRAPMRTPLDAHAQRARVDIRISPEVPAVLSLNGETRAAPRPYEGAFGWRLDRLPAGTYALRVEAEGFEPHETSLVLTEGETQLLELALAAELEETAHIQLIAPAVDGLVIAVDGVPLADDSARVVTVAPDAPRWVEAAAPGYKPLRTSLQREGAQRQFSLDLQRLQTHLTVSADLDSRFHVNGQVLAHHSKQITVDQLDPFGVHRVEVTPVVAGYQPYHVDFVFEGTFRQRLHVQPSRIGQESAPQRAHGWLRFVGDTFYVVEIDGREAGFATGQGVDKVALPAGAHEVVLRAGEVAHISAVELQPKKEAIIGVPPRAP